MSKEIDAMLRTLTSVIRRELANGKSIDDAVRVGELAVRREYAGERVYIARHPKAQHLHDLQAIGHDDVSPGTAARTLGVSIRTIYYLRKG